MKLLGFPSISDLTVFKWFSGYFLISRIRCGKRDNGKRDTFYMAIVVPSEEIAHGDIFAVDGLELLMPRPRPVEWPYTSSITGNQCYLIFKKTKMIKKTKTKALVLIK